MEDLKQHDYRQDIRLKRMYALGALVLVAGQIAIADWAFFKFGAAYGWKIETEAMNVWLSATVVQTVGIVLVITRYLFSVRTRRQ